MTEHTRRIFDDRLTPAEVADALGVEPGTLEKWRSTGRYGRSLPYYKIGRRVFYRRADVEAFIASRRREHTSKEAAV